MLALADPATLRRHNLPTALPHAIAGAALAATAGRTGAITGFETHQILDHDEQAHIVAWAKAATSAYLPPTA